MADRLKGYELTAQRLLQTVFDGGCASPCIARCTCREELAEALGAAHKAGRLMEMRSRQDEAYAATEARLEAAQSQAERLGEQDA